ncbi:hypothetical protein YC2023_083820 [Brassica napus]
MSDTFFWKVRGINDFSKHRPLSSRINKRRICFGALLETHVSETNIMYILSVLGPEWKLIANYQYSYLGKMVCGDFNEILDPRESSNPTIITTSRAMREFAACL